MSNLHIPIALFTKAAVTVTALGVLSLQPLRVVGVVGRSMEPTYRNGSFQITTSVAPTDLKKGDVVVIQGPEGMIVKRIAMMPGDSYYQVKSGSRWFDLIGMQPRLDLKKTKNIYRKVEVPSDSIYVLGDNRSVSLDSRSFGFVKMDAVASRLINQKPEPIADLLN